MNGTSPTAARWYEGITGYQWLVLVIASLGWIFDVFEGQIFVASMNEALPALLGREASGDVAYYRNIMLAAFLVGGALGGVVFGILSDRIGRKATMNLTILTYSLFTFVSAFAGSWWQMAVCRFLVAMGVGGEWAVASALVAEVFPKRARAWSLAIFHGSSVLGTYLAVAAGFFLLAGQQARVTLPTPAGPWEVERWRLGFALGVVPALLIIWVRASLREPESWQQARREAAGTGQRLGGFLELFQPALRPRTLVGVGLATVGLATFWGVHIYGKDRFLHAAERTYLAEAGSGVRAADGADPHRQLSRDELDQLLAPYAQQRKRMEMLGMFLTTTGAGLGLVGFGPLCEWLGRRGAFLLFNLGGLAATVVLFQALSGELAVGLFLPAFGFLTAGMHAGYAVYFPELFPTRLRSTGAGFCFNMGRFLAAPLLFANGWLQKEWHLSLAAATTALSGLFLLGALLVIPAPETRGRDLPK